MPGYSDRLQHALAFAAKHAPPVVARGRLLPAAPELAGTGVALLLARHGAEEPTLVAAVLRPVAAGPERPRLTDKFGPDVARILHALAPLPPGWVMGRGGPDAREAALTLLARADEPLLDILVAEALLGCGTWVTTARRLGPEYLATEVPLSRGEALAWLVRLADALEGRPAWPRAGLCGDLRRLGAELVRTFPPDPAR